MHRERTRQKISKLTEGTSPRRSSLSLSRWPHGAFIALADPSNLRLYITWEPIMFVLSCDTASHGTTSSALCLSHSLSYLSEASRRSCSVNVLETDWWANQVMNYVVRCYGVTNCFANHPSVRGFVRNLELFLDLVYLRLSCKSGSASPRRCYSSAPGMLHDSVCGASSTRLYFPLSWSLLKYVVFRRLHDPLSPLIRRFMQDIYR